MINRQPRRLIPNHGCFTLIRNPESCNLPRLHPRRNKGVRNRRQHRFPNLIRVVFHPTRFRKILGKLLLRLAYHLASMIQNNRARTGRAFINGHDVTICHVYLLLCVRFHFSIQELVNEVKVRTI